MWRGAPNMDSLVALSATASFLYSLTMTWGIAMHGGGGAHALFYESAAVVVALVSVGKYLEERSQEKTQEAIGRLMRLAPDTALRVEADGTREVPVAEVRIGDCLLVKPGERIPLDGCVVAGSGHVNEAMLTGESLPVGKTIGEMVIGGCISVDGALTVRVTHIGEDTTLAKIIRFVEEAQGRKAPISKVADRVSGFFVPLVMIVALGAAGIWMFCGADFSFALRIFTCVLVIACPCALGLATPIALMVGTGMGASHGILVRSGAALELAQQVKTVLLDKTGTLTCGTPTLTDVVLVPGTSGTESDLLKTACALESLSQHPLAQAVCAAATARDLPSPAATNEPSAVTDFVNHPGRGLTGYDANHRPIYAGNVTLMEEHGIDVVPCAREAGVLRAQGKTLIFVARDQTLLGLLALADTLRPDARDAVAAMRAMGLHTVLLTGDHQAAADYIGRAVGVDEQVAEVRPTEKAAVVQRHQRDGRRVMMVGDGINDAPALVQADVGCAIGNGSDIAIDSADMVLMKTDLMDVVRALRLGRLTLRHIKQNLFWAFAYNVLGIPIAAGVLYPATGLLLSPMIGGLAMSLSSLFVVGNALRLKRQPL